MNSQVLVTNVVSNREIEINWKVGDPDTLRVAWTFEPFDTHATFVTIVADGITGMELLAMRNAF